MYINKLIRPDLPYRRYYSHVFIFSVQFSDPSPSNPWNLLKVAIQKGMLDKVQFTFFTSPDKKNFMIIQRRTKNGNECLVIIDDFADQLGSAPFSLLHARQRTGMFAHYPIILTDSLSSTNRSVCAFLDLGTAVCLLRW